MSATHCETAGHTWREGSAECMMCGGIQKCYACDATATGSRNLGRTDERACKRHSDGGDPQRRREVGEQRIIAACSHLLTARLHLEAASRDICSVIGLNAVHRDIGLVLRELRGVREDLDTARWGPPHIPHAELDHEPSDAEHGQVHGCGGLHCEGYSGETVPG